jgi:hypothetical protein
MISVWTAESYNIVIETKNISFPWNCKGIPIEYPDDVRSESHYLVKNSFTLKNRGPETE